MTTTLEPKIDVIHNDIRSQIAAFIKLELKKIIEEKIEEIVTEVMSNVETTADLYMEVRERTHTLTVLAQYADKRIEQKNEEAQ